MEASGRNRLHRQLRLIFEVHSRDLRSDSGGMVRYFSTCVCRSVRLTPAYLHDYHGLDYMRYPFFVIAPKLTSDSVTDETVLRVIAKIKDTIMSVNNDWIDRHFAFFKGLDEIKDTECALALKFGSDCYIVCPLNLVCAPIY